MRVVLQRVAHARVEVDGAEVGAIGRGYLLLVGIGRDTDDADVTKLAAKVVNLRLFPDEAGTMNRSLADVQGQVLVVSQFTLYGDTRKGRRPSWAGAAEPAVAVGRVETFAQTLEALGVSKVARGVFGADMKIELLNDGPVTLILDSSRS